MSIAVHPHRSISRPRSRTPCGACRSRSRSCPRAEALWKVVLETPAAVCAACEMDRAMLTHVRDGHIAFASVSTEHDPQLAAAFAKTGRSMRMALVDCPPEFEAVTTQLPLVVRDLDAANREIADLARTDGYVVAPIVQGGQTIGLLHADRLFSGEEITEFDRDLLWTFATGVGWAMRQAVAVERHAPAVAQAPAVEEGLAELVREWAARPRRVGARAQPDRSRTTERAACF